MTPPPPTPEPPAEPAAGPHRVPLATAARTWFGISLQTFGGPAAHIAVMHRVLVDEKRWIGEQRFLHALNFCTLLPGPEATQLAIYCGWLLNGTVGGLIAGFLFVLPGFVALLAISIIYAAHGDAQLVSALFAGVAPAVLPIVVHAVQRVGSRALFDTFSRTLAVAAFLALFAFGVPFPFVLLVAALAGLVVGARRGLNPRVAAALDGALDEAERALIADDADHRGSRSLPRAAAVLACGLAAWWIPVAGLALWQGTDSTLFRQATFFSVTAVVTFGGAYAVLTYIGQRAVEVYGWLRPGEMASALALAETTPGPLIQLVQFVAFIGAYRSPGSLNPWVAGVLGTLVVVWVTYVPCFLWIFLGAPYMESLRRNRALNNALRAVTASVVGVIANLSVYFALHTLFDRVDDNHAVGPLEFPVPEWSSFDWRAAVIGGFAAWLLFRARTSAARTVLVAGAVGSLLYLVT